MVPEFIPSGLGNLIVTPCSDIKSLLGDVALNFMMNTMTKKMMTVIITTTIKISIMFCFATGKQWSKSLQNSWW